MRVLEKVYFRNICFPSYICKVTWDGQENKKNYLVMSSISAKGINGSKNRRVDDPLLLINDVYFNTFSLFFCRCS